MLIFLAWVGLPQWNKNWHSSGESLWFDRWRQIWELKPRFVQIITCEYITPMQPPVSNSHFAWPQEARATCSLLTSMCWNQQGMTLGNRATSVIQSARRRSFLVQRNTSWGTRMMRSGRRFRTLSSCTRLVVKVWFRNRTAWWPGTERQRRRVDPMAVRCSVPLVHAKSVVSYPC